MAKYLVTNNEKKLAWLKQYVTFDATFTRVDKELLSRLRDGDDVFGQLPAEHVWNVQEKARYWHIFKKPRCACLVTMDAVPITKIPGYFTR